LEVEGVVGATARDGDDVVDGECGLVSRAPAVTAAVPTALHGVVVELRAPEFVADALLLFESRC
jgi:hypothetical protein